MFSLIAAAATTAAGTAGTILAAAEIISATGSLLIAIHPLVECIQNRKKKKDED
ncbi:MAG: hypothetical protein IJT41_03190 [Clostridia bacterium]|nr:hypothetical protein [Clostridia bacterium]